jgi:hypothetical protein
MEEKQTWFWRKEADGCANLLRWLRDSGEKPMVMLASSASSLVLKKVKSKVMVASSVVSFVLETGFGERRLMVVLLCWVLDSGEGKSYGDAGLLCWFPGSEESEAGGDGGFLWYFLRSGREKSRWWLNSSVGVAFSDFAVSFSSVGFAFSLLSLFQLPPSASLFFTLLSGFYFFFSLPFLFSPLVVSLPPSVSAPLCFFAFCVSLNPSPPPLPLCFSCFYRPETLCW